MGSPAPDAIIGRGSRISSVGEAGKQRNRYFRPSGGPTIRVVGLRDGGIVVEVALSEIELRMVDERRGEMSREDYLRLGAQPLSPLMELARVEHRARRMGRRAR